MNELFNSTLNTTSSFEVWKPRLSLTTMVIMILIPTIAALCLFFFGLKDVLEGSQIMYSRVKRDKEIMTCWDRFFNVYRFFNTVVVCFIKYTMDTLDVMFDLYMFYQLEHGDILEETIYRNPYVSKAIYLFANLGIMRILRWKLFANIVKRINGDEFEQKMQFYINLRMVFGFSIEDGPEMVLEYLYIEKYITQKGMWYLLARDVILGIIYCYSLYKCLKAGCCSAIYRGYEGTLVDIHVYYAPIIAALQILRIIGAARQYSSGEVKPECFNIESGKRFQNPFSSTLLFNFKCLDSNELFLTCTTFITLLVSVYFICFKRKLMFPDVADTYRKYKDRNTAENVTLQETNLEGNLRHTDAV